MNYPLQIRMATLESTSCRPVAPQCRAPGCENATRERKPYCSDHVELHPYVAELTRVIAGRERELAAVGRRGAAAVDLQGVTCQEIVLQLRLYGPRSVPRLSRDLGLEERVVEAYAQALRRCGAVALGSTRRGLPLLTPLDLARVARPEQPTESAA